MAHCELAPHPRDQITKGSAMPPVTKQTRIFLINRLPIGAVHFGVVEILALDPPRLAIDLRPLCFRIDAHLQLRDVEWSITNFRRPLRRNYSPTARIGLIEQFLL